MNSQENIKHKKILKTRNQIKNVTQSRSNTGSDKYNYVQIINKKVNTNNKHKDRNQRMKCNHELESQQIVIDLNLGQYGFDMNVSNNFIQEIQKIVNNCQLFSMNPSVEWKQICSQITNALQNESLLIQCQKNDNKIYLYKLQSEKIIEINQKQTSTLLCVYELLSRIKQRSQSPGLVGIIASELEKINRFLKISQYSLNIFRQIEKKDDIKMLICQLQQQVAFKTFIYGLQDLIIDELNYFLLKQFQQNSRNGKLQNPIKNWEEWAQFIQRKRVRLRKANKFLLHTACQFCLSSYTQQLNPLQNCSQCHIRGHKLCLGADRTSRCGRCIYLRLPNQMKNKIPECFICSQKNLAPLRITSSKFAHIFCLMVHGLWNVNNSSIRIQQTYQIPFQQKKICKYCNQLSQFCSQCKKCGKFSHHLCAYMNGSCFQIQSQKVIIKCCELNEVSAQKFAYQRKYILNYDNIVFKKLVNLQRAHKKSKKTKIREYKTQKKNLFIDEQLDESQINIQKFQAFQDQCSK